MCSITFVDLYGAKNSYNCCRGAIYKTNYYYYYYYYYYYFVLPLLRNYFGLSFRASFNCCQKLQYSSSKVNGTSLGRALVNVTDLPQLSVRANGIKVVNEETLPWEFRRNVTWIDLAQNPFNCTCELLWFRRSVFWRTSDGCWCRFYGLCFKNGFRRIIIRLAV